MRAAAAAAAGADVHDLSGVGGLEDQSRVFRQIQNVEGFFTADGAPQAVFLVEVGARAEHEAGFQGLVAALSHDPVFFAADAGSGDDAVLLIDEPAGFFVGHDPLFRGERPGHRDGSQLGGPKLHGCVEEVRDVFVHVADEIGIQVVHVVFPDADDELGGHVANLFAFTQPEDQSLSGQVVEPIRKLPGIASGAGCDFLRGLGFQAELPSELRLLRRKKPLENPYLHAGVRPRESRWKAIQVSGKLFVDRFLCVHWGSPGVGRNLDSVRISPRQDASIAQKGSIENAEAV